MRISHLTSVFRPTRSIVFVFLGLSALALRAEVSKEYQLKAAFLYNFTKFVEWPPACFADDTSPIVIGILGRNPFGAELASVVAGRTVNGRGLVVKSLATAAEAASVHLLFVPAGEEAKLAADRTWRDVAVVTVGESPQFAALGGTITFRREADRVTFAVDLALAEHAGLKVSAQLLKLATSVRHKP